MLFSLLANKIIIKIIKPDDTKSACIDYAFSDGIITSTVSPMNRFGTITCADVPEAFTFFVNMLQTSEGYAAKQLFREYPWLKRQYFWNSGMWNPSYYFDSLGSDLEKLSSYVRRQGMPKPQRSLAGCITN